MLLASGIALLGLILSLAFLALIVTLLVLAIRCLLKYLRSGAVRKEQAEVRKSLGETIREYRTARQMTQEFVAESLGVSRQAVSKWESGASDPSTSNLIALAKLFQVSPEELLSHVAQ